MHKLKNKKTVLFTTGILLLLCLSAGALLWQHFHAVPGTVALIYQDGELIRQIDLSHISEPYSFTIESTGGGYNTIYVETGRIGVSDADCPDRICQKMGMISDSSHPISCLPHRLLIKISGGSSDLDAIAG